MKIDATDSPEKLVLRPRSGTKYPVAGIIPKGKGDKETWNEGSGYKDSVSVVWSNRDHFCPALLTKRCQLLGNHHPLDIPPTAKTMGEPLMDTY